MVKERYERHCGPLESALKALKRCLVVTGNGLARDEPGEEWERWMAKKSGTVKERVCN